MGIKYGLFAYRIEYIRNDSVSKAGPRIIQKVAA